MAKDTMLRKVVKRIVEKDLEALGRVMEIDILPDVEYRNKLENELFDKAYKQFLELKEM
jgi:hypothetical protein